MLERKRKKHDYADRLKYMHLLELGRSFKSICKEYGINHHLLMALWGKYQKCGVVGLQKSKSINADFELKKKIVRDIEKNHITLYSASLKYGASTSRISIWLKMYSLFLVTQKQHVSFVRIVRK